MPGIAMTVDRLTIDSRPQNLLVKITREERPRSRQATHASTMSLHARAIDSRRSLVDVLGWPFGDYRRHGQIVHGPPPCSKRKR